MTTLIAGGLGFIGVHTVEAFVSAGEPVVATYYESQRVPRFLTPYLGNGLTLEQCDIGNPGALETLARKHSVDGIVNLAIHRKSSVDPGEDMRINMDKLSFMLDGARAAGVKRLGWASNGAIYTELPNGPFTEDTYVPLTGRVQPGAFKKAWEVLAHNYAHNYALSAGLEIVSMRISGVFGPTYRSMLNLPSRLCHAASKGELPNFSEEAGGTPFAEDTLDLTYAKDIGEAIRSLQLNPSVAHSVYHISRGATVTPADLVAAVKRAKPTFEVELQQGRGPRYRQDAYLDNTRITQDTGWNPRYTIEESIAAYIDWLDSGETF